MAAASHQEQREFFERVREGFASAAERCGEIVRNIQVAGTRVRLRFAGGSMMPAILNGLARPVGVAASDSQLCEILIWDSESSGVTGPPPPRPRWDFTGRGSIWGFDDQRYRSAFAWGEGSVSVMDRAERLAVYWAPSHSRLPLWMMAAPLRSILHWWMELNGRQLVHAAAVGLDGEGVLMPGRGGSGKSSTALACLLHGFEYVSDDYLALELGPEPRVYPLYWTAKLDPDSLKEHRGLADGCLMMEAPGFEKAVLFLEKKYASQLPASLGIRRILKPTISGSVETTFEGIGEREMVLALAAETLVHLPHTGAGTIAFLERATREIPCSKLLLGSDRDRIPEAIRQSLQSAAGLSKPVAVEDLDPRPFISLIVHLEKPDLDELKALAGVIEEHGYPRTELVVTVAQADSGVTAAVSSLPGFVRILTFRDKVWKAMAWNRAIREAFADLLFFLESGDRVAGDALDAFVRAAKDSSSPAWVKPAGNLSLRGALVRKSAFVECGLFNTRFEGREQQEWIARARLLGLRGTEIPATSLRARA
jgi:hypothetical protein